MQLRTAIKVVHKKFRFHTKKLWDAEKLIHQLALVATRYKLSPGCMIEIGMVDDDFVHDKYTIIFYEYIETTPSLN